jgi:hypothetical protein
LEDDSGAKIASYKEEILKEIRQRGEVEAYDELKKRLNSFSSPRTHQFVHIFGEELYEVGGPEAMVVCDQSFGFGCYHGFMLSAIGDRGVEIVEQLDKICAEKYGEYGLGCNHGIGHGIMDYFGQERLSEALNECAKLKWHGKLMGCQGGAFMEYFFPSTVGQESPVKNVQFDEKSPYVECQKVDERFRLACYYELTTWWKKSQRFENDRIAELCSNIHNNLEKEVCFLGLGHNAAFGYDYDIVKTVAFCRSLEDPKDKFSCSSGAYWSYINENREGKDVCKWLNDIEADKCLSVNLTAY